MKNIFSFLLIFVICGLGFGICRAKAIYNPVSVPNNRFGIHILDPQEVEDAVKLVNSSGGDWGYVTIPIRSDNRDRDLWIKFFTACRRLHLIPIIRLATYPDGNSWVAPTAFDLVDFANFLSDMPWPTQNRYIVLFNEPNHANEWGGEVDPLSYATLLLDAHRIFKSHSPDFFLISAGLDMSAPNSATSMDALDFYTKISRYQPDWYANIDGLTVHAYPNPAFSSSPFSVSRYGITSYRYEENLLKTFGYGEKPLFITETGWANQSENNYFPALYQVWTEPNIIAITPFVLFAGTGDFAKFSFLDFAHQPKNVYRTYAAQPKIAGSPLLANVTFIPQSPIIPDKLPPSAPVRIFSWLWHLINPAHSQLTIKDTTINVEIADNDVLRARGLSGRDGLNENSGMLFTYAKSGRPSFWMKDMRFALDFVWIKNNQIVELAENVPPPKETNNTPTVITPKVDVNSVLELPAGFIEKHNLQLGDSVVLNSP